jgi:DNA-binding transcriptional regulator YiaG
MANSRAMARTARKEWEKRVARLRDSDLTDGEFAAEIGVNVHTLRSWKWKLAAEQRAGTPTRAVSARRRRTRTKPKATFVEMYAFSESRP